MIYQVRLHTWQIKLMLRSLLLLGSTMGEQSILIDIAADWKYLDDGSDQDSAWIELDFNDSAWATGPAQLGYGDGDEATIINYGNFENKHKTQYFRHTFEVTDTSQYLSLLLCLLRDDGAVVHLNGAEIERDNMPAGEIDYQTLASVTVNGDDENNFFESFEDPIGLRNGQNILAVEVHRTSGLDSDLSFDLQLLASTEIAVPDFTRKEPYLLYSGVNTEMKVLWQLIEQDTCLIQWGLDTLYTLGNFETYEYGDDHQHTFTFPDLVPGTKYYYEVNISGDVYRGSFRSAPDSNATDLKFFAYGDTRTYPSHHDAVGQAMINTFTADEEYQTFALGVGDFVSNGNLEIDWDSQFFDDSYTNIRKMLSSIPLQGTMGNHEYDGFLFQKYFPYPFEESRYWSFDYGPIHVVVVDQYTNYFPGSVQHNWIQSDLASTDKSWKFIVLHEPGWTSGGGHENSNDVQNNIQPLCRQYGVSVVFGGHNHYYSRVIANGVTHITTGGGGAPLYPPDTSVPDIVVVAMENHYCKIEINGDQLNFEVVNIVGVTIDSFTLSSPTGLDDEIGANTPQTLKLFDAYPNPFNPNATVSFNIPATNDVDFLIYNIRGELVKTLESDYLKAGHYRYTWNGKNDLGKEMSSGVYIFQLRTDHSIQSNKIMLLR
jgi:hypothetical protein